MFNLYLIVLAIIFIIMLNMTSNRYGVSLLSFFITYIIFYWIFKDMYIALGASSVLLILYNLYWEQYEEGFESGDMDNIIKSLKEVSDKYALSDDGGSAKLPEEDDDITKEEDDIDQILNDVDEKEDNISTDGVPSILSDSKYFDNLTPAKAQRETFRLIKTIEQLDDTMKSLAPTLKKGATLIDKFKKLNIA